MTVLTDDLEVRTIPAAATSLVDLLDRLLGAGVVLCGDLTISLAGVDLVLVRLRLLISTIRAEMERSFAEGSRG